MTDTMMLHKDEKVIYEANGKIDIFFLILGILFCITPLFIIGIFMVASAYSKKNRKYTVTNKRFITEGKGVSIDMPLSKIESVTVTGSMLQITGSGGKVTQINFKDPKLVADAITAQL